MWIWVVNLILLFVIELVVLVFVIPKEYLINIVNIERNEMIVWFASERTAHMIAETQATFQSLIVDSGFKQTIIDMFYIDPTHDYQNNGLNKFASSSQATWANERVDSLWIVIEAIILRWDLFLICLGLSLLFLIPTIVDGLCSWQKLRSSDENASINFYNVAEKSLYVLLILPIYGFFAPFPITPPAIIMWALFCAFCIWIMTANLQHRI